MKKAVPLFLLFLLVSVVAVGQKKDIDSLRNLISTVNDTVRMKVYFELSLKYKNNITDSAEFFAKAAVEESRELNYVKGEADGLISLGRIIRDRGEFAQGLALLSESLELYRRIDDVIQMGNAFNDISIVYAMSDDYEKSLEYFLKALERFEKANDPKGISYALNNIGVVYQELNQDSLAREYFIRSLNIKEQNADTYGLAQAYVNLATVLQNYELLDEALVYYFKADSAFSLIDDKRGATRNLVYIAGIFMTKKQLDTAWKYARRAYDQANQFDFMLFKQDALQTMVDIKENKQDYKAALYFQKEYQQVTDSLAQNKQMEAVEELKAKFDMEEKDRQIEFLKNEQLLNQARNERQRLANYLLVVSVVFMLVTIILLSWAYLNNRKKNKALTNLNKEKDQFISILSHDIKGPLNTLKGFSGLLIKGPDQLSKEELMFFGNKVNDSIDNLLKLVNGILEWSFYKQSASTLNPEKLEVAELINDVVKLYELTAYQKNIKIINEADQGATCLADRNVLLTVLRNLLSNAIKFSKSGDFIKFSTASNAMKQLRILISDTGVGITKEDLPRLFEYSKAKVRVGTKDEVGSGLGLALSKELIENSGGYLSVESEEGIGSRFSITLPIATS
ncbi:MAG: tetratricopeptide repeat-containing sensor histidine kinase [Bacteroidota bacterium]